jgi:hypothetical protein
MEIQSAVRNYDERGQIMDIQCTVHKYDSLSEAVVVRNTPV